MAKDNETVDEVCAEMRSFGDVPPPRFAWRDLAERAEAAHKRELAAKDKEIEKRDTVIKELADALEKMRDIGVECAVCGIDCGSQCVVKTNDALIAKAREVLGGVAEKQYKEGK